MHGQAIAQRQAFISSRNAGRNFVPATIETPAPEVFASCEARFAFKQMGLSVPPRRRVLIVGDSPGLCAALVRGLRHPEIDLRTAEGAARGFAILARESVDFVIAELSLPPSGGIDFLEVIRKLHPSCSRVLITGDCNIAVIRDAIRRSGVSYFLGKPWDAQSLHDLVRNFLLFDESAKAPCAGGNVGLDAEFYARSVRDELQGVSRNLLGLDVRNECGSRPIKRSLSVSASVKPGPRTGNNRIANRAGSEPVRTNGAETLELNDLARDLLGAGAARNPLSAERE